jgi:membrane protease YdiL (CAAX protease family)
MNLNDFYEIENINRKRVGKRARMVASICVFSLALMFALQLASAFIRSILMSKTAIFDNSSISLLMDMLFYVFYIVCPFGIAALVFKSYNKNTEIFLPKRSAPKYSALYVVGAIGAGYILNLLINLLFPNLVEFFGAESTFDVKNPLDVILCVIMTAVLPAIIEEWAFRGVLLKNLLPYGRGGAIVISSILFGLAHVDPPRIIFATAFGLMLGLCYEYTGSILVPMLIHFINNSISVMGTLMPEDSLFVMLLGFIIFGFIGCGIAAIIIYSIGGIKKQKVSLNRKLQHGYTLPVFRYTSRMVLNFAFIPLLAVFSFIFILSYFPQLFNGIL